MIRNTKANAVIAIYPLTPQCSISQALISAVDKPIFCDGGDGVTSGIRVAELAQHTKF